MSGLHPRRRRRWWGVLAVKVGCLLNESFLASTDSSALNRPLDKLKEAGHRAVFQASQLYLSHRILNVTQRNLKTPKT